MLVNKHLNGVRRRVVKVSSAVPLGAVSTAPPGSPHADILDDRDAMWRALAGIPCQQRTVLVLRSYEGLEDATIAALVGCRRTTTVRSLAARGLAALRKSPHIQQPVDHPARRSS